MNTRALTISKMAPLLSVSFVGARRRIRAFIVAAVAEIRHHQECREAIHHLRSLDDAFLKDIGIERSEITRLVMGPREKGRKRRLFASIRRYG